MKKNVLIAICIACTTLATALFAQPVFTGLSPNFGPTAGGTTVTIIGSGFTGATSVNFGSKAATTFTVVDDSHITATTPVSSVGAAVTTVTTPSGTSPFTPFAYFVYQGDWFAYVTSASLNQVAVFDATTAGPTVIQTIPSTDPFGTAFTPDGTRAYVCEFSNHTVSVIDVASHAVTATISLGTSSFPTAVAISPDGTQAYIGSLGTNSVSVINVATNIITATITSNITQPLALAVTPDGRKIYVGSEGTNKISVIQVPSFSVSNITVGNAPQALAVTPDGAFVYVTNTDDETISVIDVATDTVITTFPGNTSTPQSIAITPDGTLAYVGNFNNNTVSVISLPSNTVITTIPPVGTFPNSITITPNGLKAYVANNGSNNVAVINIPTNTTTSHISVAGALITVAITPDQAPVALFTTTTPPFSFTTTFDATKSQSPTGTIINYAWNFGDGTTLTTTTPVVQHTFPSAGSFTVTLTVTNSAGTSTAQTFTGQTVSNHGGPSASFSETIQLFSSQLSNLSWEVVKKKTERGTDYTHILMWKPSNDPSVVAYQLVRNGRLIKTVPATGPFVVRDKRGKKNRKDTYVLVAVSADDTRSKPLVAVIPKQKSKK